MDGSEVTAPRLHPMNQDFVWQDVAREGLRRLTPAQVDQFRKCRVRIVAHRHRW